MFLSFLLIILGGIFVGILVNYFYEKLTTCKICKAKEQASSAWEILEKKNESLPQPEKKWNANDILGSDFED